MSGMLSHTGTRVVNGLHVSQLLKRDLLGGGLVHASRFVLSRPLVASVVVGATAPEQLREVLSAAAGGALPQDLLAGIDRVHEAFPNPNP